MHYTFAQVIDGIVNNLILIPEKQFFRAQEFLSNDLNLPGIFILTDIHAENYAVVGGFYNEEMKLFSPPSPHPSWSFDWDLFQWIPPIPQPEGLFYWDEELQNWSPYPSPFPSWIWDGSYWHPPIDPPETGGPYEWDEETLSWVETPS